MGTTRTCQAPFLQKMIAENNETRVPMYLEQLLLFPLDIQDIIIEEISHLDHCDSDAIARIIHHYSMIDIK
ncbi:MAG TPA: hypothetical protein DE042_06300 [Colwellia sp.]|nr:hypothetical protein [Colwellia sp.]